ncbi:hypothetical protein U1Q18_051140 [Sarracenia purpurea var. burkii]
MPNNEIEKAWSAMMAVSQKKFSFNNDVFIAWIEKANSEPDLIERLFKFFQISSVIPKKLVCDHLVSVYSQFPPEKRLAGSFVSIDSS